jgi:hypothetical protein
VCPCGLQSAAADAAQYQGTASSHTSGGSQHTVGMHHAQAAPCARLGVQLEQGQVQQLVQPLFIGALPQAKPQDVSNMLWGMCHTGCAVCRGSDAVVGAAFHSKAATTPAQGCMQHAVGSCPAEFAQGLSHSSLCSTLLSSCHRPSSGVQLRRCGHTVCRTRRLGAAV